jgi:hypothetical protein
MEKQEVEKHNGWMCLFIVETLLFAWIMWIGTMSINNESKCKADVCADQIYDSYNYDSYENICYCYTKGEVALTKYIG